MSRLPRLNVHHLNKEFVLFRNNAVQKRRFQGAKFRNAGAADDDDDDDDEFSDARVRLLRDDGDGKRRRRSNGSVSVAVAVTPDYVARTDEMEFQLERLHEKIEELDKLVRVSSSRPAAFDDSSSSGEVSALAQEVTRAASRCHETLKRLRRATDVALLSSAAEASPLEARLAHNIVSGMANRLREAAERFAAVQGSHLKRERDLEEKSKKYFGDFDDEVSAASSLDPLANAGFPSDRRLNTQELIQLEENTIFVETREKEINRVVRSIADLNLIFKDLAHMVSEQGTILDRIDHNVEHTQIRVADGLSQLKKAERHHRADKKMHCIVILAVIVIFLLFILIYRIA